MQFIFAEKLFERKRYMGVLRRVYVTQRAHLSRLLANTNFQLKLTFS